MKKLITLLGLLLTMAAQAETPQEAAQVIHDLIKSENYSKLFTTRYSEWHKVETDGITPEKAVEKLSGMFKKQREPLLAIYSQLAAADFTIETRDNPQISETGKVATATVKLGERDIPFKLYEMKSGLWGFHL